MATSIMACLRTSRCIFVSPFILGTKSWHLHECRHCVCCMKLTKRSVQLAFDPAHRVFFRKKLKNSSPVRARERAFPNMKARSRARYQLYRKASLKERACVFLEKAGWNGGSASTQGMAEIGVKFAKRERFGAASGFFPFRLLFFFSEDIYLLSLFILLFSLSGTAFRGVGFYRNGRWGLLRWGFGGGGPFYLGRPNPRSCLLLLSNPALFFLISKGKALIQLLVSLRAFHLFITRSLGVQVMM